MTYGVWPPGVPPPLGSMTVLDGGLYVPRRSLDRFAVTPAGSVRNVVIIGDSVSQGTYMGTTGPVTGGYFDGWITRLARALGQAMGPLVGAGAFPVFRSGATFANSAAEWGVAGSWLLVTNPSNQQLAPFGAVLISSAGVGSILTYTPPATVVPRWVADAVTNGTTTITSATAAFTAADIGSGVYGTNLAAGASIVNVTNATTAILDRVATGSSAGGLLALSGRQQLPGGIARVDLIWVDVSGVGPFSYSVDNGGTWINVVSTAPALTQLKRTSITTTLPNGNFQVRAADSAGVAHTAIIVGVEIYNAVAPTQGVMVHNLCRDASTFDHSGGSFVNQGFLTTGAGDSLRYLDNAGNGLNSGSLQPSLVILMYSNDAPLPPATFTANLSTLLARIGGYADLIVVNSFEQNRGDATSAVQTAFRQATKAWCAANSVALIDLYDAYVAQGEVGFAGINADGLMLDGLHITLKAHADIAGHIMRCISTLAV